MNELMSEETQLLAEIAGSYSDMGIGGELPKHYLSLLKRREVLQQTVEEASDTPKFKKIPRLLRMLEDEIAAMEGRMHELVKYQDIRIFSVACDRQELREALDRCQGPGVIIGFNGGATLTLDSDHVVKVICGFGHGLAVVGIGDLWEVAGDIEGMIVLDCDREGWETWSDMAEKVKAIMDPEHPGARRFEYFTKASE
jgi:hypothetical protein